MHRHISKELRILEFCVLIVCVGLVCLLHQFQGYKMVVLNLFFLPVVLTGFFLGRYRAGVLALFCVVSASAVAVLNLEQLAAYSTPVILALSVTVWGATLGMTAILVGTLSDERLTKTQELHEAYVGVVEVLAQYLQSANPRLKARAVRVAELSQRVAETMKLTPKEVDDIRVAALLYDLEDVEITAKVIREAVGTLEAQPATLSEHTFRGKDLVLSLGPILSGAMPLLHRKSNNLDAGAPATRELPLGSRVIQMVRDFDELTEGGVSGMTMSPGEAVDELRGDGCAGYDSSALQALERVVRYAGRTGERQLQPVG